MLLELNREHLRCMTDDVSFTRIDINPILVLKGKGIFGKTKFPSPFYTIFVVVLRVFNVPEVRDSSWLKCTYLSRFFFVFEIVLRGLQ